MPEILTVAMSGAYRNSDELPPEVIADAFYAKGEHSTSLFGTLAQLLRTAPARRGDHHRQLAQLGSLATGMTPKEFRML